MTFVPPPLDPDRQRGRIAAGLRKPWIGAGLLACLLALRRGRRRRT